jgi:hypothetical protein
MLVAVVGVLQQWYRLYLTLLTELIGSRVRTPAPVTCVAKQRDIKHVLCTDIYEGKSSCSVVLYVLAGWT